MNNSERLRCSECTNRKNGAVVVPSCESQKKRLLLIASFLTRDVVLVVFAVTAALSDAITRRKRCVMPMWLWWDGGSEMIASNSNSIHDAID